MRRRDSNPCARYSWNRAADPVVRAIQKLDRRCAPHGPWGADRESAKRGQVRRLPEETLEPLTLLLVINTRCPSKAAVRGPSSRSNQRRQVVPLEARTTETEFEPMLGTQMFVPSKTG
jgi:hypothetical protein